MKFKGDVVFTVFVILILWDVLGIGNIFSGLLGGILTPPTT